MPNQIQGVYAVLQRSQAESTYGTAPTTVTGTQLPFNSCTLRSSRNLNPSETITGRRDAVEPFQGYTDVRGEVVVPVDEVAFGYWLQCLMGDPTTTGAGPYTHTYKVTDCVDSYTFEVGYEDPCVGTDYYAEYNGCKVDSMSITFGGDGELTATFGLIGAAETVDSTSMDASPATITLDRWNNFQADIEEGGASIGTVKELELTVNNNLDDDTYIISSSSARGSLPDGIVNVSGRMMVMFENWTLYNKAVNGTESSLKVTLTEGTYSLEFHVEELIYERNAPGVETMGGVWLDMPFQGYFGDGSNDSIIKVTLVNGQSSY